MSRPNPAFLVLIFAILIAVPVLAQEGSEPTAASAEEWATPAAKTSYAIGLAFIQSLRGQKGFEADDEMLLEGVRDGLAGEARLTGEEVAQTMNELQQTMMEQQQAAAQVMAAENLAEGEAFLAAQRDQEGIVTLDSGLQYSVLEPGEGASPGLGDQVKVHYVGTLLDGTKFDSSYDRGNPATFSPTQVIAGWTEALQLMAVGSKWRLFIPSDLAYGERAQGPIPPNSTLIFEVELLEIVEAESDAATAPVE